MKHITTQRHFDKKSFQLKNIALALALCAAVTATPLTAAVVLLPEEMAEHHVHTLKEGELVLRFRAEGEKLVIEVEGLDIDRLPVVRLGALALPLAAATTQSGDGILLELDADETVRWSVPLALLQSLAMSELALTITHHDGAEVSQPISIDIGAASETRAAVDPQKAANKCPWLVVEAPSANAVACSFASKKCADKTKQHTGIDYSGNGSSVVRAAADGTVVAIEYRWYKGAGVSDHGMGTSLLLQHQTSDCKSISSMYAHLDSIQSAAKTLNSKVSGGTTIGTMGGSGYGDLNYWSRHLHFEMKALAVTGNPVAGKGCKTKNSCWGYTPDDPKQYGYMNPSDWIGK